MIRSMGSIHEKRPAFPHRLLWVIKGHQCPAHQCLILGAIRTSNSPRRTSENSQNRTSESKKSPAWAGQSTKTLRDRILGCSCSRTASANPCHQTKQHRQKEPYGRRPTPHLNLADGENGLVASATNITNWSRSTVPLLKTSIGMSAPCPFMECPASA